MPLTIAQIAAVAVATLTLGACAAPVAEPELNLSPADVAACALLPRVLDDFSAGYSATEAFNRNVDGWPAGMPSDSVRAAFNAYRTWVATEENEDAGVATYDQSVSALANAMGAQQRACGS
jgi:hypothetical protein